MEWVRERVVSSVNWLPSDTIGLFRARGTLYLRPSDIIGWVMV